jgi:hypothetical protein
VESRVIVEEFHLFSRQWSQDLLDDEKLIYLTLSWEQRLAITQLPQDTAY